MPYYTADQASPESQIVLSLCIDGIYFNNLILVANLSLSGSNIASSPNGVVLLMSFPSVRESGGKKKDLHVLINNQY